MKFKVSIILDDTWTENHENRKKILEMVKAIVTEVESWIDSPIRLVVQKTIQAKKKNHKPSASLALCA